MFAQIITMKVPPGNIEGLRTLIMSEYLTEVRNRPGFVAASLLEQVDDRNTTQLIIYWETQRDVEAANQTTGLAGSPYSIAARIPGMRVQRQSYIIKVSTEHALQQ
jgi:hypothetical protein